MKKNTFLLSNFLVATIVFGIIASTAFSQGKGSSKSPIMGWASWNNYGVGISESIIKGQADAMVSSGLAAVGFKYINIDDGFFDGRNADGTLKIDAVKFPNGMKNVADYIHSKGLKGGFYSDAGANTCGSVANGQTGGVGAGLYNHDQQDIDLFFKNWGFDFLKVDWCGGQILSLDEATRYTAIKKAIDNTGRTDISYNVCRWRFPGVWVTSIADSWRISGDIHATWTSVMSILDQNAYLAAYASQGHYNDMDMLEVGRGMSAVEDKSHFSMWCILSSPLLLGNDLTTITQQTKDILTNTEVIAVNQDTTGTQAQIVSDNGAGLQVWAKNLNGKQSLERAVVLLNRSDLASTMTLKLSDLNLEGPATIRDLWLHTDLNPINSEYTTTVPSHGVVMLKIIGAKNKLKETFEAEYAWMNNFNLNQNNIVVANQGQVIFDNNCSGLAKVVSLGKSADNYIEFREIYAKLSGKYTLTITYLCGDTRNATMSVNGKDALLSGLNSGGNTLLKSASYSVNLNAGYNTIRFSNATGSLPDLDKIQIGLNSVVSPWDGIAIATSYALGDGTSTNPYQISTPAELAYFSQNVNAGTTYAGVFFILTNDLDLNSQPWTPIGNSTNAFKGTFDGNSHLISNLTVNLPTTTGVGLFGYVQDALVKNIGIAGVSTVSGYGSVGGIIGRCVVYAASGFGMSGCFSNATVSSVSSTDCVGGIVGIFRSTQTASPTNPNLIDNCYSKGNITGNNYVAGIVGKVEYMTAGIGTLTISDSYSTGLITATGTAPTNLNGGIVTKASTTDAVYVTNCYYINGDAANANGAVAKTATVMQASGFVTLLNGATSNWKSDYTGGISVNNGFPILAWRITVPGIPTNITATAGSSQVSVAFTDPANNGGSVILDYTVTPYSGAIACTPVIGSSSPIVVSNLTNGTAYTFKVTARNALGSSVASLVSNAVIPTWDGITIASCFAWGNGTVANPWQINSPEQLADLSQRVNGGNSCAGKYFILTCDLDLNGLPWTPIGKSTTSFNGIFDGNKHLISNLNVNLPSTSGVGLFGTVQDASIKNVGIVGTSTVTGAGNVGGIVGQFIAYSGSGFGISGCFSNATISSGSVTGNNVGGIVGDFRTTANNIPSSINNCYTTGNISGTSTSGINYVAGIVGKVEMGNALTGTLLTISNSYATGTKTATGGTSNFASGIAKIMSGVPLTVTNCYYINGAGVTGATVQTAAQMQASGFVTTLNGSQSPAAWQTDFAGVNSVNNGFPILVWRTLNVATNITRTPIMNGRVTVIGKTVTVEAPVLIKNMQLYNILGQLVKSKNINYAANQLSFDVQQAGIYLLIAHTAEGQLSQKIILK
jgi:hypothetical protein